jgi:hypothetical protein
MPFGKYRGTLLSELPGDYLDWLASKLDEWREPFHSALAAELARRKGSSTATAANGGIRAPARRGSPRLNTLELPAPMVCDVCGLGPTDRRPLVHASCVSDEVPF